MLLRFIRYGCILRTQKISKLNSCTCYGCVARSSIYLLQTSTFHLDGTEHVQKAACALRVIELKETALGALRVIESEQPLVHRENIIIIDAKPNFKKEFGITEYVYKEIICLLNHMFDQMQAGIQD